MIGQLLKEEIFIKHGKFYMCECGSVIKKSSIYAHIKTQKHIKWLKSEAESTTCNICYDPKIDFFSCPVCEKEHCTDCYKKVKRCPFCRAVFDKQNDSEDDSSEDDSSEDDSSEDDSSEDDSSEDDSSEDDRR